MAIFSSHLTVLHETTKKKMSFLTLYCPSDNTFDVKKRINKFKHLKMRDTITLKSLYDYIVIYSAGS